MFLLLLALAVPGVVIDHSPAASGRYIGSPSLAILPDGGYVASHDFFGPKSGEKTAGVTRIFRSRDRGDSWGQVAEIRGAFWSSLFVHRGALYLIGDDHNMGNPVIRRSMDGGGTWTTPSSAATGQLRIGGNFHCGPMAVIEHDGRLWRPFERRVPMADRSLVFGSGMFSAPVDGDLLQAATWTVSNFVPTEKSWNAGDLVNWREGNAVPAPDGGMVILIRTQASTEKAGLLHVSGDGRRVTFDAAHGFVSFPGAKTRFAIRFDPQTRQYWSLGNTFGNRNVLALSHSADLVRWTVQAVLLSHPDRVRHAFQYVDWQFDGDDIVAASRTAFDDEATGAHSAHDSNYLTFHRFAHFRTLTSRK